MVHGYQANAYDEANRTQYLTNAGDVRSRGLEFEATALPIRGLTLNFNASYNDVRYLSYKNARAPRGGLPDRRPGVLRPQRAPGGRCSKYIANLNGEYRWKLDDGLEPYLTASYAFRSRAVGTIDDSAYGQIPSYALVNASAGLRGDYGDGQWDLSLWLKNAFDKTYFTSL